ncbi:26S proteasome regulatory subunit RPN13, putative [Plasmodium berghei]|uniref:26S proteasome regulatory subunit RPN13, putative n=2 Tax=Plasmodium berghei TaxID=5821 RepID=A0A509AL18_PLABA|nr:26S proteasome regulatory subunit RPN13, putative [Plasmodium berghei ANKA]CXI54818.1 26S proteasome regulatory subunit RPN13, putative [Plasmodium berghei]SCM17958.1 26S proteasome regulatory subunit RPN13, putative [Plasmodium berghei]VUC56284.1 26S proteasome regulatory subunit RPN13, putative [Plasmodium berghei ANKA]|eukprot:XP_034422086.1 26S proteasome regulatory subunit RPN13, putative [Plasmodium berghei ANKA]
MDLGKIYIEINAGKCIYDGNVVKPDKRKGKLVLYKICDNLYNFQWISRETNKIEDNVILTKNISLERVHACKTGRVYLLRNKLKGEVFFYWMQDCDESKDEEFVSKFNSIIENDLGNDTRTRRRYNKNDIPGVSDLMFSQGRYEMNGNSKKNVSFKDLFVSEYMSKLLEIPEAYEELKKHMPNGYQTKYDIESLINSRMLNSNLNCLDLSIQTQLNFILVSLNLPPHDEPINNPLEYIVEALEKKYDKENNN